MIMGHIKFGAYFDKWIHGFHMPMFFFVSGWFYRRKDDVSVGKQVLEKVKTLLLPYIIFELVQWIILLPFIPEYRNIQTLIYVFTENTYKIPVESGTFGISPIPGAMWFLTAIFFMEAIYIVLNSFLKNNWNLHCAVVILVVLGILMSTFLPLRLPLAIDAAFVGIGFFHIARMIHGTKAEKFLNLKLWQTILVGLLFSFLIMVCPKINMRTGNYGWYLAFYINALGTIVAGWNLSRYVDGFLMRWFVAGHWLKNIGKNSIVYLCLNQIVILAATKILNMIGTNAVLAKFLILLLTMIVLFVFEKMICNTKLKITIGK